MAERQVLDREAGRVEQRDLVGAGAPVRRAGEDGAELGHVVARDEAGLDRAGQLAAVAGLRPLVAEEPAARRPPSSSASALPGPSAPSMFRCTPGRRSPARTTGSCPGVTHVTTSQASASSRAPASQPSSPASAPAASGSRSKQTPGPYSAAARQRAAHAPCSPQPTIPTVRGVLARELLRGDGRHRARPQRGDRAHVDQRERLAGLGARDADHPHHHRQPARRVAGERRDPLQDRQPAALRRHRAEVAVGRHVEVDLRRHPPLAARVADEAVADALDRLERRDRREHGVVVEDRDLGHGGATIPCAVG